MTTAAPELAAAPDGAADARARFVARFRESLAQGALAELALGKYRGAEPDLRRLLLRPVLIQGELRVAVVSRYATRDTTANCECAEAVRRVESLLGADFLSGRLCTATGDLQIEFSRKGRARLLAGPPSRAAAAGAGEHDRAKFRHVDPARPFLHALGVTDAAHNVLPSMFRKWRQIDKFIEIFQAALTDAGLPGLAPLAVADFGAGKGYLTFAVHDHLRHVLNAQADVTGVERRADLVGFCSEAAARLGMDGLRFVTGGVDAHRPDRLDVLIALHACDTATDLAIALGVRAGASVLLCAPCCHKQLRPQLVVPATLRPLLRHGIHAAEEAAMLTDSLRALLLESRGYTTEIFEFISLEHTSKNRMIRAVRRPGAAPREAARNELAEIKAFYGIREFALEALLEQTP